MRLLIVGGLEGYLTEAGKIALERGVEVTHVPDCSAALQALRSGQGADLVFLDIAQEVETFIQSLKSERIMMPVITCGINANSTQAANSIRAGASDYIPLPPDAELIASVLEAVSTHERHLIFQDEKMRRVLAMAEKIAASTASVLITGESGTGKEVIAQHIHQHSTRKNSKFISVNCAAIPENLLESELFGHEKGAFTGAVARRIGKFEEASGGTLLLDEISEMDPRLQAKLLRAIQEREIDRVGGNTPIKVDIRLLATSNRDLLDEVKKGTFREDLYFRLNVVRLDIPALRERPEDILPLCQHFVEKYSQANGLPLKPLNKAAQQQVLTYGWPGNVRELENAMHRAVLLSDGPEIGDQALLLTDMTQEMGAPKSEEKGSMVGRTVSDVEKSLILETLDYCSGNRTHAANILGISIRTLRNKLKQYTEEETLEIPAPMLNKVSAYKAQANK